MSKRGRASWACAFLACVCIQLPAGSTYGSSTNAAAHISVSRGKPLYTWNFADSGHRGAWRFVRRVLEYDGNSNGVLLAHVDLRGISSFAVQATMQGLGPGGPVVDPSGFGLIVRQAPSAVDKSVRGGPFFSSFPENNNPELSWNGDTVGGAAFQPHRTWHLYRLEVRPGAYTLIIDGRKVVEFPLKAYPHPKTVGVFSAYYRIRVRNFSVQSLVSSGSPTVQLPRTKAFALTVSDLPSTTFFNPVLRHFYTNVEIARERSVSVSSLVAAGRLVSYETLFYARSSSVLQILDAVTAYKTVADARADLTNRLDSIRLHYSQQPNLQSLPPDQIGEKSGGLIFDVLLGDVRYTTVVLSLARGRYTALQQVTIAAGTITPEALLQFTTMLARDVDGRLQHGLRTHS